LSHAIFVVDVETARWQQNKTTTKKNSLPEDAARLNEDSVFDDGPADRRDRLVEKSVLLFRRLLSILEPML
jgi:hypothetical protein